MREHHWFVPENLQEAAFNRAFEALLAEETGAAGSTGRKSRQGGKRPKKETAKPRSRTADLDAIDRTNHPEISHEATARDNSLRVLRVAKDTLDIDGLDAGSISRVLVDKFRCRVTREAVPSH